MKQEDLLIEKINREPKGGQHTGTTETGVKVTHTPSKVSATCEIERSQYKNRDIAIKMVEHGLLLIGWHDLDDVSPRVASTVDKDKALVRIVEICNKAIEDSKRISPHDPCCEDFTLGLFRGAEGTAKHILTTLKNFNYLEGTDGITKQNKT